MTAAEFAYLRAALEYVGISYIWNGKDSSGLDCSGHVTFSLFMASGGRIDHRARVNTDVMWREYPVADGPAPGRLVLYGRNLSDPNDQDHVMTVVNEDMCVGACGGGHLTTKPTAGAMVQIKPLKTYRASQISGYRCIPFFIPPQGVPRHA